MYSCLYSKLVYIWGMFSCLYSKVLYSCLYSKYFSWNYESSHNLCSRFFMLLIISCLSTPRFCSLSVTSRHKSHSQETRLFIKRQLRQAKRHYSVIRRRPVSRESHRPRDIPPSSGDGLCPGRATGNINELQDTEQNIF